jgi:hypothetical protein
LSRATKLTIAALLGALSGPSFAAPDDDLLIGARAFEAGRFAEAADHFAKAELGTEGRAATWYKAAALYKLGKIEASLAAFLDAEARAPELRDELLDFYFALTCSEAKLFRRADRLLVSVLANAGPKVRDEATKARNAIAPALSRAAPDDSIDWYLSQAKTELEIHNRRIARAYFEEAASRARDTPRAYRLTEALAGLEKAEPPAATAERAGAEVVGGPAR